MGKKDCSVFGMDYGRLKHLHNDTYSYLNCSMVEDKLVLFCGQCGFRTEIPKKEAEEILNLIEFLEEGNGLKIYGGKIDARSI